MHYFGVRDTQTKTLGPLQSTVTAMQFLADGKVRHSEKILAGPVSLSEIGEMQTFGLSKEKLPAIEPHRASSTRHW